ncbi:TPA: Ras association domain family 2 [Bos taurus]|nr:TPA: Ras association domain family 2 [Bos taurus]
MDFHHQTSLVPCGQDKYISKNELLLHLKTYNLYYEGHLKKFAAPTSRGGRRVYCGGAAEHLLGTAPAHSSTDAGRQGTHSTSSILFLLALWLELGGSGYHPEAPHHAQHSDLRGGCPAGERSDTEPHRLQGPEVPTGRHPTVDAHTQGCWGTSSWQCEDTQRPAANQTPPLLYQRPFLQPQDISVHASLWLHHQCPHQQHHDDSTGPEVAAQQIEDWELGRGVCTVCGPYQRRETEAEEHGLSSNCPDPPRPMCAGLQSVPVGEGPGGGSYLCCGSVYKVRDACPKKLHSEAPRGRREGSQEADAQVHCAPPNDSAEAGGDSRDPS